MKTTSLHIAFAALLSLLLLASCSRNDEVAVAEGEEGKVYVTLTLSINGEEVGSRATWNTEQDTDEEGVGWENKIDDLQILIYDANNNYVGKVEDLIQLLDGRYSGTLSSDAEWTGNTNYKIMAFANCPSIDNPSNISTLDYTRANVSYIPMWGVTTTTFDLTPGESDDIGSIDLLRAMAKVEVSFSDDFPTDEYTIGNVILSPYNTKGNCLPAGYASVDATGELDREETSPASFNPLDSPSNMELTFKGENNSYYIYLPEYDNSTKPAKIQVTVNDKPYDLEFKDYENGVPTGDPYDIVRNHIYRYSITGVNDGKLVVQYRVLPWDLVKSEIGYGDENSVEAKLQYTLVPEGYSNQDAGDIEARLCVLYKPSYDGNYNDADDEDYHGYLQTGSAGARYEFTLSAPAGTIWKAHLSNPDDFYFSHSETDGKRMVSTGIARSEPYILQINVNADHAWTENTSFTELTDWGAQVEAEHRVVETYFYITISMDGEHEEDLVINPANVADSYYKEGRRYAGTDTRIWIRQVPAQKGWSYDDLARNIDPSATGADLDEEERFQWWRVNPYWK